MTIEQLLRSFLEENFWVCFAKDIKRNKKTAGNSQSLVLQKNWEPH